MEEALIVQERRKPLTAEEIKAQVQVIQKVMAAVMEKDVHYGVIPGTKKPTLYKPGSEKILATFHIAAYPKEIEDLSTQDEIRYRVKVHGFLSDGELVGVGIGECSSEEEKYKWRKPVCDEEFNETPDDRKRIVWKKGDSGPYQQKQVRMKPADVANTVLKMAKKRAQIDMTLTATAASDVFDQDLEDLPEGMDKGTPGKPPIQEPQKKTNGSTPPPAEGMISEAQRKRFYAIAKQAGKSDDEIKAYLKSIGIEHTKDIPKAKYDDSCKWAEFGEQEPGAEADAQ